ncbi:MAG TPA: glycosyltransferase family 2 protein [Kiritimatiellia bacterium]|nr:glycosyltransferase family 2 protein [Kiritimatiellia bacterium]
METPSSPARPHVWAVVLGYNHPEVTLDCLQSLAKVDYRPFTVLYVDNGSERSACEQVMQNAPGCGVLRLEPNAGVAGGFNAGIRHALAHGADYVLILNNDTTVEPGFAGHLVDAALVHPRAGLLVPKIYYHGHPDTVWSAGSVFRRFPPVVTMRKTRGPDDGRFDRPGDLDFATFCVIMFSRAMLETAGLMDPDYHFLYEDYDLCLRAREAGFDIRYVPDAHVWHKISMTTGAGTPNPQFWHTYGRSESIFRRKFRRHRWLTGWTHAAYIVARFVFEGNRYGVRPYLQGWRQGARDPLHPPPHLDTPSAASETLLRAPAHAPERPLGA